MNTYPYFRDRAADPNTISVVVTVPRPDTMMGNDESIHVVESAVDAIVEFWKANHPDALTIERPGVELQLRTVLRDSVIQDADGKIVANLGQQMLLGYLFDGVVVDTDAS